MEEYKRGGVYNIDTKTVATITAHAPGYLDRDNEIIVGFQTDEPLKRSINPWGGIRTVDTACKEYGYQLDDEVNEIFSKYRRTRNKGVFRAYTKTMKLMRKTVSLPVYLTLTAGAELLGITGGCRFMVWIT